MTNLFYYFFNASKMCRATKYVKDDHSRHTKSYVAFSLQGRPIDLNVHNVHAALLKCWRLKLMYLVFCIIFIR